METLGYPSYYPQQLVPPTSRVYPMLLLAIGLLWAQCTRYSAQELQGLLDGINRVGSLHRARVTSKADLASVAVEHHPSESTVLGVTYHVVFNSQEQGHWVRHECRITQSQTYTVPLVRKEGSLCAAE